MKTIAAPALQALADGTAIVTGALKLTTSTPFLVWGGYEPLVLASETYAGIGDRGIAQVSGGSLGSSEQGAVVTLSGVDPDVLAEVDGQSLRGVDHVLWRMIFDGHGTTLLDAQVFQRGRVDRMSRGKTAGGASSISLQLEGASRRLGHGSARAGTDADQRLIDVNDGSMSRVSYAGQKTLQWGGKPAGTVVNSLPNISDRIAAAAAGTPFRGAF